jgi:hypothetical protein
VPKNNTRTLTVLPPNPRNSLPVPLYRLDPILAVANALIGLQVLAPVAITTQPNVRPVRTATLLDLITPLILLPHPVDYPVVLPTGITLTVCKALF